MNTNRLIRIVTHRQQLLRRQRLSLDFIPRPWVATDSTSLSRCHSSTSTGYERRAPGGFTPPAYRKIQQVEDVSSAPAEADRHARNDRIARLKSLQSHFYDLLNAYQTELFQAELTLDPIHISSTGELDVEKIKAHATALHEKYTSIGIDDKTAEEGEGMTWSRLESSEGTFRDLCRVVQQLISVTTIRSQLQPDAAEQLIRLLVQIRLDRTELVDTMLQSKIKEKESSVTSTVKNWISNVFISSPEDNEATPTVDVRAHADVSYGPSKRHFKEVVGAIFFSVSIFETDYDVLTRRVDRMSDLLKVAPELIQNHSLNHLLEAHVAVGTLDYAERCENIWKAQVPDVPSPELFQLVLRAYDSAARNDPNIKFRSKAAKQAERLALQMVTDSEKKSRSDPAEAKSVAIAISALASSSRADIPERCERAENLTIKYMGRLSFASVFAKEPPTKLMPQTDVHVLAPLLLVYSTHLDLTRLRQAQQVLHFMEQQLKLRHERPRSGKHHRRREGRNEKLQGDNNNDLPTIETYRNILTGIQQYFSTNTERVDEDTDANQAMPELAELALYSTGLLEKMQDLAIVPDMDIFDRILNICSRAMSTEGGERAEEILNRMILREIYDPKFQVTMDSYVQVLRCWKQSSSESHPQAAERADRLLRSMEAQSGILTSSLTSVGAQRQIYETAYNQKVKPDIEAYNLVLQVCSNNRNNKKRGKALEIALSVYHRIFQAGLLPNVDTYKNMFFCVSHQTPKGANRNDVAKEVIAKATYNGRLDPLAETALKAYRGFRSYLVSKVDGNSL